MNGYVIRRGFEHPDLDIHCAELAAKLQRGGMVDEIHQESKISKQSIRIDCFIIAIAIINGAEKIITNNEKEFKKLCRGKIDISGVPFIPEQLDLGLSALPENEEDEG